MVHLLAALAPAIAFVNVNVIRIDAGRVEPAQTVVVSGDRIVAIGAAADVAVPSDATRIDGTDRYLLPGLADAHVHLTTDMPWAPARPDFGEAPLYLAHGVTTVVNLRGTPAQLEWRQRINSGALVGPTIYTAGDFINEPRVATTHDVADDIAAQQRAGYDLIKFHEIFAPNRGYTTTTGLSLDAYRTMIDSARAAGMPLVGHAPVNLGLNVMLDARQPLAHVGMLSNIYFLPLASNRGWVAWTIAAFGVLTFAVLAGGFVRRSRVRRTASLVWLCDVLAIVCAALFLPGGPMFESVALRIAFSVLVVLAAAASVGLAVSSAALWRDRGTYGSARLHATVASAAGVGFACAALAFWLPIAWRSSDWGIERLALRVHDAGMTVQTTLVVYEAMSRQGQQRLIEDPAVTYLLPDTQAIWRDAARAGGAPAAYAVFMKKVAGAMHRAGVPLVAGTDAMGAPLIAPGSSLVHELELLTACGLTPSEAIRAATLAPAAFLHKENEFGSITVGKRADLLLLEHNPLEDIARLKQPAGVMARGTWLPRAQIDRMLAAMKR